MATMNIHTQRSSCFSQKIIILSYVHKLWMKMYVRENSYIHIMYQEAYLQQQQQNTHNYTRIHLISICCSSANKYFLSLMALCPHFWKKRHFFHYWGGSFFLLLLLPWGVKIIRNISSFHGCVIVICVYAYETNCSYNGV